MRPLPVRAVSAPTRGSSRIRRLTRADAALVPLLAGALLVAPLALEARTPPLTPELGKPLAESVHQTWDDESGLPQSNALALAQTRDGYLWIGSEEGLTRFDGRLFTTFTRRNTPGLGGNYITALLAARDGSLLVGTRGRGLSILKNRRFTNFTTSDGLLSDSITALAEGGDGTFWIGTAAGLHSWNGRTFRRFTAADGLPGESVSDLAEDDAGTLWIGSSTGIASLKDGRFTAYPGGSGVPLSVTEVVPDGDAVWIGTRGHGLLRFARGRFETFTTKQGLPNDYVLSVAKGNEAVWIGTQGGVSRLANGAFSHFDSRAGLLGDHVWSILEDRDGSVWIGTTSGLNRLKASSVVNLDTRHGLSHEIVLPILQMRSGEIWVGTAGGGLNRYRNRRFEHFDTTDGLSSNVVVALAEAPDGSLWIGTTGGVNRFADGRIEKNPIGTSQQVIVARSLHVDRNGSLWIGTPDSGAIRVRGDRREHFTTREGLAGNAISDFHEDRDGVLWIASETGGLSKFHEGRFSNVTRREGLPINAIISISETSDGSLWLASSGGGVVRMHGGRIRTYTTADGLFADTSHRVLEDDDRNLWISSNKGISFIARQTLEAFDAGRVGSLQPRVFNRDDGMNSRECNGGVDPAGQKMRDGSLWFPTMKGITVIDPRRLAAQALVPSAVVIEKVVINGVIAEAHRPIVYVAGKYNVEISYASPTLSVPDEVRYQYKLEGFDPRWIDAGERRIAYYTQLPPGSYRFHVRARTSDGVAAAAGDPIEMTVRPRLYQRPLFYLTVLAALVLLAFAAYRARIRALMRRESDLRALVHERALAQEALRQSEQHFRSLIENASDMILTLARGGRILYASPSVEQILGYSQEWLRGRSISAFVHREDAEQALRSLTSEPVKTGAPVAASFRFRHKNGSWRSLEAIARALSEPGNEEAVIVNCRDVTDRELLQNQLEQANRLTSLGRLAATVAHEFNNVLMGISPFAEILERSSDDGRVRSATGHISAAVKRGKRITDEILRYARPHEPVTTAIRVEEWLHTIVEELEALVGPDIQIRAAVADPSLVIKGDLPQLNQVMTNLILNARDAMPEGGTITIEAIAPRQGAPQPFGIVPEPEKFVQLVVRDPGIGMTDEVQRHMFDPLFTTKKTGGTGLGLTVAHQVIKAHHGEIFAESTPGEGTAFHLFLPRGAESEIDLVTRVAPVADDSVRSLRVLLVEDDEAVRGGIEALIEAEHWEVRSVATGGEAQAAVKLYDPDVVLLDVGLPDIGGVQVYEMIAAEKPELPVIFSTGHGDQLQLEQYLSAPHVGFLLKPYEGQQLLDEIRRVVKAAAQQSEAAAGRNA